MAGRVLLWLPPRWLHRPSGGAWSCALFAGRHYPYKYYDLFKFYAVHYEFLHAFDLHGIAKLVYGYSGSAGGRSGLCGAAQRGSGHLCTRRRAYLRGGFARGGPDGLAPFGGHLDASEAPPGPEAYG